MRRERNVLFWLFVVCLVAAAPLAWGAGVPAKRRNCVDVSGSWIARCMCRLGRLGGDEEQRIGTTVVGAYLLFIHIAGDSIAFPLVGMLSDRFGLDRAIYVLPVAALIGGIVVLGASRWLAGDVLRAAEATTGGRGAA